MYANGHVVLLHAFPLNSTLWRPQIERAPTGWRFVAPDLPGFGASVLPAARSVEAMAREVLNVLDEQGIAQAVIGGMSMGGYVTLALYRLAPERFAGMVLADTRATPQGTSPGAAAARHAAADRRATAVVARHLAAQWAAGR